MKSLMTRNIVRTALTGLAVVAAGAAEAQSQREAREGRVSACSRYGHGCTSAPIRKSAYDYEFRMPGGTWIGCRTDCKQTLREEVLDFWETQRERNDRAR